MSDSKTSATTKCPVPCTITSKTKTTARTNRARTRIGIAERVELTATPAGSFTWSVTGGGAVHELTDNTALFIAGDRASTSTITASQGACKCKIIFTVIEPNGAEQVQFGKTMHTHGIPSAGFKGITYLLPKDVSFENIEINEGTNSAIADGIFLPANGRNHPPWPNWATVGGGSDSTGSVVQGPNRTGSTYWDFIHTSVNSSGPWSDGTFVWNIPWEFRVNGGTKKEFTTLIHRAVLTGSTGKMTQSKGGVTVSAMPNEPTE